MLAAEFAKKLPAGVNGFAVATEAVDVSPFDPGSANTYCA
jgi:hypothetical protein